MKKNLTLFCCLITIASLAQTDYQKLKSYHSNWNLATGIKFGELTGIQVQLFRGKVCGGHKDNISKLLTLELTVGDTRLPSRIRSYGNTNLELIERHGFRAQVNASVGLLNMFRTDWYVGGAVQMGQRRTRLFNNTIVSDFTVGITPYSGLERHLFRMGNNRNPIYLNVFAECAFYAELDKRYFGTLYLSSGIRANFWR